MTRSWVRDQPADPFAEAWARGRVRNLADPREIRAAIDAMPIGRPTWPAHGPREQWHLVIDDKRADRILAGEAFELWTSLGWGFPLCRSRGVEILPDATRELCIDVPAGMLNGARAFSHYGRIIVLILADDLFSSDVRISEARKIAGGVK